MEAIASILLVLGGVFAFIAALGVLRMPDIMMRIHASTKAGTLGVGFIMAAVAVYFAELGVVSRAIAAIIFMFVSAPVASHLIARAAYRMGVKLTEDTVIDEMKDISKPRKSK
jgi:multicomponent Na+:H+ antiporter subunit G